MLLNDVMDLRRLKCHIPAPHPKSALCVHALDPRIQRRALGAVLFGILTFDLQHQGLAIRKSNQKIGHETLTRSIPQVINLETQVIIFGVRRYAVARIQNICRVLFPCTIRNHVADLRQARRQAIPSNRQRMTLCQVHGLNTTCHWTQHHAIGHS